MTVDTTKPITVSTQFITTDGTEKGDLIEIKRIYKQGGKVIPGGSITDESTRLMKIDFNQTNQFAELGGLKTMGKQIKKGMALVLSIWGDTAFSIPFFVRLFTNLLLLTIDMDWLDSVMKDDIGKTQNGTVRGPCKPGSTYQETLAKNQNSAVVFSNIQITNL